MFYDRWSDIWKFHPLPDGNKVEQLAAIFKRLILEGKLSPGSKMPPIRLVAKKFHLGHGTVKRTYDLLQAQDILYTQGKRTFIRKETRSLVETEPVSWPKQSPFLFRTHKPIYSPAETAGFLSYIAAGSTSPDLPASSSKSVINYYQASIIEHLKNPLSAEEYKRRIATGMRTRMEARGIFAEDDQVLVIPNGSALQLVASTLISPGDCFVISSAADINAQFCFQQAGAQLAYTGLDDQGMNLDRLELLCRERTVKGVFIRSTADYPYNVTISEERRTRLVDMAKKYSFVIVALEEDYELWFSEPLSPMVRRQHGGRVIHISPVSKLNASFKSNGLVVASPDFIRALSVTLKIQNFEMEATYLPLLFRLATDVCQPQQARKVLSLYETKKDAIERLFNTYLSEDAEIKMPDAGLSVWIMFKWKLNASQFFDALEQFGFYDLQYIRFQDTSQPVSALHLGFGARNIDSYDALFQKIPSLFIKP